MLSGKDLKTVLDQYDEDKGNWRKKLKTDNPLITQLRELYSNAIPDTRPLSTSELSQLSELKVKAQSQQKANKPGEESVSYSAFRSITVPPVPPEETFKKRYVDTKHLPFDLLATDAIMEFLANYDKNKKALTIDSHQIKRIRTFLKEYNKNSEISCSDIYELYFYTITLERNTIENLAIKKKNNGSPDLFNFIHAIDDLDANQLMSQADFTTIIKSHATDPINIIQALRQLKNLDILSDESRKHITKYATPKEVFFNIIDTVTECKLKVDTVPFLLEYYRTLPTLTRMHQAKIPLTDKLLAAFKNAVTEAAKVNYGLNLMESMIDILINKNVIITPPIISMLENYIKSSQSVRVSLEDMHEAISNNLAVTENLADILTSPRPKLLSQALNILSSNNILTPENKSALMQMVKNDQYAIYADAIYSLHNANILTTINLSMLVGAVSQGVNSAYVMPYMLLRLHHSNILTQANFDQLIRFNIAISNLVNGMMSHHEVNFQALPDHLFNQDFFNFLIQSCDRLQGPRLQNEIRHHIQGLLNIPIYNPAPNQPAILNTGQSTHTASVHKTVSKSALRLKDIIKNKHKEKYKQRKNNNYNTSNLDKIMAEINAWAKTLPGTNIKQSAAKTALPRLQKSSYIDPASKVSTRELIALAWLAIHDDKKRMGSLNDALNMFTEGLYECQRGYNLDLLGNDTGKSADKAICEGGTFNKIVEKLVGVHPDVRIKFITPQTAAFRLQKLVSEYAKEYLKKANLKLLIELIDHEVNERNSKNDDTLKLSSEVLWEQIAKPIKFIMQEEGYLVAFSTRAEFDEAMNAGVWQLDATMEELLKPYQTKAAGISKSNLFTTKSESSGVPPEPTQKPEKK